MTPPSRPRWGGSTCERTTVYDLTRCVAFDIHRQRANPVTRIQAADQAVACTDPIDRDANTHRSHWLVERFANAVCVAAANRSAETPCDGAIDPDPNPTIDPNRGLNRP